MSEAIPFNKTFDLPPGRVDPVLPGIRRIVAPNPSPFTFTGTVTYIVGHGRVAVIDPGPEDEGHVAAILEAVGDETVSHILVTHTHRDHSPAVRRLKAATGAVVLAEGPHRPARPLFAGENGRARREQRRRLPPRPHAARRGSRGRRRLELRGRGDRGPYGESHGLRAARHRRSFLWRPRHGLVDLDRGTARRGHARLHGVAAKAANASGTGLPSGARAGRRGRAPAMWSI